MDIVVVILTFFLSLCPLQSGYFSSMFSGSWKESNMLEINLEIPDQNIDTEGVTEFRSHQCVTKFILPSNCCVCVCSPPSGLWVAVSGRCSDKAQPGH